MQSCGKKKSKDGDGSGSGREGTREGEGRKEVGTNGRHGRGEMLYNSINHPEGKERVKQGKRKRREERGKHDSLQTHRDE